jgi:hypothetical protein
MDDHDHVYHKIFGRPWMLAQLLRAKRPAHTRAYRHEGVLVELFHVRPLRAPDGRDGDAATGGNIVACERDHLQVNDAFYAGYPAVHQEIVRLYGDAHMPSHRFFPVP